MLRVGVVNYINSLPILAGLQRGLFTNSFQWSYETPSVLNHLLATNQLDVALISAAEFLRNTHLYELLPPYCIGAKDRVMSVCLYLKRPIENVQTIAVTPQSASSTLLLKILCKYHWQISPKFEVLCGNPERQEAFLLIGDECLDYPSTGFEVVDLAHEWYQFTKLPFTFALFALRKEVKRSKTKIQALSDLLDNSYRWGKNHREEIERLAFQRLSTPLFKIRQYYQCLQFTLNESQKKGLQRFKELAQNMRG